MAIDHALPVLSVSRAQAAMRAHESDAGPQSKASHSMPAQASKGDANILLKDGQSFRVHSALLALNSPVLEDAVDLTQAEGQAIASIRLPSTSAEELQALLEALYSQRLESHMNRLPLSQLRLLSSVCHRFSFQDLLSLLDQALAKHAGEAHAPEGLQVKPEQYLTFDNAAELYWDARAKGFSAFETACASFIGANMKAVAEATPDDGLGPILNAAAAVKSHQAAVQPQVLAAKAHLQQGMQALGVTATSKSNGWREDLRVAFQQLDAIV